MEVGATENPGEEPELELDDDPAHATQVDTSNVPVIITVSQVEPPPLTSIFNLLPACLSCSQLRGPTCRVQDVVSVAILCSEKHFLFQAGLAYILDASSQEETCIDCAIQLAVDSSGAVCGLSKLGPSALNPAVLQV